MQGRTGNQDKMRAFGSAHKAQAVPRRKQAGIAMGNFATAAGEFSAGQKTGASYTHRVTFPAGVSGLRPQLAANRTYYVASGGNDANSGAAESSSR